jgi:uncharacterized membrane protein YeiH
MVRGTKRPARSIKLLSTIATLIILLSALWLFYARKFGGRHCKPKQLASDTCGLAVFLGSGTNPCFAKVAG